MIQYRRLAALRMYGCLISSPNDGKAWTAAPAQPRMRMATTAWGARRYYYEYNSGLQAQSALYTMPSLDDFDNATLVFDPNALSKDGTVAVNGYAFNWGGDLIAYNIARRAACGCIRSLQQLPFF